MTTWRAGCCFATILWHRLYAGRAQARPPAAKALAELKGSSPALRGTEAGWIADYSLRQRGYFATLYRDQLAVLTGLNDSSIDYAYLWANVAWLVHASPDFAVEMVADYVPEDHWNIAIAMRHGDDDLKKQVDAALAKLIKDGSVEKKLGRFPNAILPPFPEKAKDKEKGREGDKEKGKDKDAETRKQGEGETGRQGDFRIRCRAASSG